MGRMKKAVATLMAAVMCASLLTVSGVGLQEAAAYSSNDYPVEILGGEGAGCPRLEETENEDGTITLSLGTGGEYSSRANSIEDVTKIEWYATSVELDVTKITSNVPWDLFCENDFYKEASTPQKIDSGKKEITIDPKNYTGLTVICLYYDGSCQFDYLLVEDNENEIQVTSTQDFYTVKNGSETEITLKAVVSAKEGATVSYQWLYTNGTNSIHRMDALEGATKSEYTFTPDGTDVDLVYACAVSDGLSYDIEYYWVKCDDHEAVCGDIPKTVVATKDAGATISFALSGKNIDVKILKDSSVDESGNIVYTWRDDVTIKYDETAGTCSIQFPYEDTSPDIYIIDKDTEQKIFSFDLDIYKEEDLLVLKADNALTIKDMTPNSYGDEDEPYYSYLADFVYTAEKSGLYSFTMDAIENVECSCRYYESSSSKNRTYSDSGYGKAVTFKRYLEKGESFIWYCAMYRSDKAQCDENLPIHITVTAPGSEIASGTTASSSSSSTTEKMATVTANVDTEALLNSILTEEEIALIKSGEALNVVISVDEKKEEPLPETEQKLTTEAVAKVQTNSLSSEEQEAKTAVTKIAAILDINLEAQIGDNVTHQLTETGAPVELSVTLPEDIPAAAEGTTRTYRVIRIHNGEVTILDAELKDGKICFSSDKYSTYILVYTDVAAKVVDNKVGDPAGTTWLILLLLASGAAIGCTAAIAIRRRKA